MSYYGAQIRSAGFLWHYETLNEVFNFVKERMEKTEAGLLEDGEYPIDKVSFHFMKPDGSVVLSALIFYFSGEDDPHEVTLTHTRYYPRMIRHNEVMTWTQARTMVETSHELHHNMEF